MVLSQEVGPGRGLRQGLLLSILLNILLAILTVLLAILLIVLLTALPFSVSPLPISAYCLLVRMEALSSHPSGYQTACLPALRLLSGAITNSRPA